MSRNVESIHQFRRDEKFRLTKDFTIIRCDDGTIYEFEKPKGNPRPRLVRSFDPDGTVRNKSGRKMLASAVEETVETMFGGWEK